MYCGFISENIHFNSSIDATSARCIKIGVNLRNSVSYAASKRLEFENVHFTQLFIGRSFRGRYLKYFTRSRDLSK